MKAAILEEIAFSETGTSPLNLNINKQTYGNAVSRLVVDLTTQQWSEVFTKIEQRGDN